MIKDKVPVSKALNRLVDTIKWYVDDDYDINTIVWNDETVIRPSNDQIEAMRQTIADETSKVEYIEFRANGKPIQKFDENGQFVGVDIDPGYPSVVDQLDMLWHAIDQNKLDTNSDFYRSLKAVKDKYPKGS